MARSERPKCRYSGLQVDKHIIIEHTEFGYPKGVSVDQLSGATQSTLALGNYKTQLKYLKLFIVKSVVQLGGAWRGMDLFASKVKTRCRTRDGEVSHGSEWTSWQHFATLLSR